MPRPCLGLSPRVRPPPVSIVCRHGTRRHAVSSLLSAAAACALPPLSPPSWASVLGVKQTADIDPKCGPIESPSTPRKPRTSADAAAAGARPRAEANVAAAERAALDDDRERATREFVDSMWQGLE